MKFVNISGLPRSGSTLLGCLLDQHPDIDVCFDSDLSHIVTSISNDSANVFDIGQFTIKQYEFLYTDLMRSVIKSWTNNLCKREVYVDKCRGWENDYDLLFKLIPNAKVIYLMRDLRGVISSFEKVENYKRILPVNDSLRPDNDKFNDVDIMEYRVDNYLNDEMLSTPLYSLKELLDCSKLYYDNFKFVRYEDYMENPKEVLSDIYNFIGIKPFDNNLSEIKQGYYNDACFAPYGDHTIRKELIPQKINSKFPLLKKEAQERIIDTCSWFYNEFYPEVINN